jgi:hypothetical protein
MFRAITRKRFLVSAGGAAGTAAVGGAGIGLIDGIASARTPPSPEQDRRIIGFLLELQRVERAFYAAAVREGRLQGELAEYLQQTGINEAAHVQALEQVLGGTTDASAPRLEVRGALRDPAAFTRTAAVLEDTVVAAMNGQVTNLTPERLQLVCSIVSVDARHAAWIHAIGGTSPAGAATDAPLDPDAARDRLRREGLLA